MKFTTRSALAGLALASTAAADGPWQSGDPPPFFRPHGEYHSTCVATSTSTVSTTTTITTTSTAIAYKTLARGFRGKEGEGQDDEEAPATVAVNGGYGGPGPAATVTVTTTVVPGGKGNDDEDNDANHGKSGHSAGPTPAGPAGSGPAWSAPVGPASTMPAGSAPASPSATHAPAGGPVGHHPHSPHGSIIKTIATGTDVWPIWSLPAYPGTSYTPQPSASSAPYSNGTHSSNSTVTWNNTQPHAQDASCNDANSRNKWCDGLSIDTDYYSTDYSTGRKCEYHLEITNTTINFDGTYRPALAVNGQVPGPAIECNWGDTVIITVSNKMQNNGTAIHWHGIRQLGTNPQDGVPGVTECPIAPGDSRTYQWKASQYGSSWYHSHYATQYGDGVRGPIIIHGPTTANYDIDMGSVMIDDLFAGTVSQANDFVAHNGPINATNYLLNGKNTKPDLSAGTTPVWKMEAGKKHLFRFVNSASQSMWVLHLDNHVFTVVAADFVPIVPYTTEWLNIGVDQRYDVIVEATQPVSSYFLRAVTQTGCPGANTNNGLGNANGIVAYEGSTVTHPNSAYGSRATSSFATCLDEPLESLVPHLAKPAGTSSSFTASSSALPVSGPGTVATSDDGVVFVWTLNGASINVNWDQPSLESLYLKQNISNAVSLNTSGVQWVYFVIQNLFFASHPMHMHGHDFSILGQGQGHFTNANVSTLNFDNPMRRDTAMLEGGRPGGPLGYTVIGFETDNPGAWLMHCHITWHVDGGLAMQFIERPGDIPAAQWTQNPQFQNQCNAYEAYEDNGGALKSSGESGLKKRAVSLLTGLLQDAAVRSNAVRRAAVGAGKEFLDSHVKRAFGDGFRPRHRR